MKNTTVVVKTPCREQRFKLERQITFSGYEFCVCRLLITWLQSCPTPVICFAMGKSLKFKSVHEYYVFMV